MQSDSKRRSNKERTATTRAALLAAARRHFIEKGYADTGTPEIVAAANVTRGALYHHFADKQALFRAVVEQEAELVEADIERAAPDDLPPRDALIAGGEAYLKAMALPGRTRLLLIDGPPWTLHPFVRGAAEVLFDRICRDNGIVHRLTQPATPTTTGKIERFHQTLRRDLLADHGTFADLDAVQATLDAWVANDYNTRRHHRSLDMATPSDRFVPVPDAEREALPLRLPAALAIAPSLPEPPKPERVLPLPPLAPTPALQNSSHMMIANPFRPQDVSRFFSTHPPMAERIARLETMAYGYRAH